MRTAPVGWALCAWLAVGLLIAACRGDGAETPTQSPSVTETPAPQETVAAFTLLSDAFDPGEAIPPRFTCDGENISPALFWSGAPQDTQSYALIVDDPDAPGGTFTHWVLFDLPADARTLEIGVETSERPSVGGAQGGNDAGGNGYTGPCPPSGPAHRYQFTLYALDQAVGLEPGASKQDVLDAIEGHILAEAEMVGTYGR